MRIKDIIFESASSEHIEGAVEDLLTGVLATKVTSVSTEKLAQQLQAMGHSVTVDSLITLLNGNPLVQSADEQSVTLVNYDEPGADDKEYNQSRVQSLASKAAKKGIA